MGIKKMNMTYIKPLERCSADIALRVTHLYVDANELIYGAIERFKEYWTLDTKIGEFDIEDYTIKNLTKKVEKEVDGKMEIVSEDLSDEEAAAVIRRKWLEMIEISVYFFLEEIKHMIKLEMLVIGFDGVPAYGKIQEQNHRRKIGHKRFYYKGNLVFSQALVLPETRFGDDFTKTFQKLVSDFCDGKTVKYNFPLTNPNGETISAVTFHKTSTRFSMSDIPGEAEHKILNILREDIRNEKLTNKTVVVWSADSDTIVALIGVRNLDLYVRTKFVTKNISSSGIVKVEHFRNKIIVNAGYYECLVIMLIFQFLGNDYLPEMHNTMFIETFFDRCWAITTEHCKNLLINIGGVYVINTPVLMKFFQQLGASEFASYCAVPDKTRRQPSIGIPLPASAAASAESKESFFEEHNRVGNLNMKRKYYTALFKFYNGNENNTTNPSDEDLYEFEMDMAVNYLEVFYWYFYYLNGYHVCGNLENPYYRYAHPPLYESLHQVLRDGSPEQHARFNYLMNKDLAPKQTTHEYYEKLPRFPILHHYMVLPKEEFAFEYPTIGIHHDDVNRVRNTRTITDRRFPQRVKIGAPIVFTGKLNIEEIVKAFPQYLEDSETSLIVSEREHTRKSKAASVLTEVVRFNR